MDDNPNALIPLTVPPSGNPLERVEPTLFPDEIEAARYFAEAARAPATRRVYASDWRLFTAWCAARSANPLPADPALVAVFLAAEARGGAAPPTIGRRLAAIAAYHLDAGFDPPHERDGSAAIRKVMTGIRRKADATDNRKSPADGDALRDMLQAIKGDGLRAIRDRAVLAIGMAGALRRSELVALDVDDVELVPEGLKLFIAKSKTDQERKGATIVIPEGRRIRPKELLLRWIDVAARAAGPLFLSLTAAGKIIGTRMSDKGVARVVKARAAAAGMAMEDFSGHSLRSGFITEAARQGATIFKIREVSRHKSVQVLSDYVREAQLFRDHAGAGFL